MPSVAEGIGSCISDSLKKSLQTESRTKSGKGLDNSKHVSLAVSSSAKRALLEKTEIKFVKSSRNVNSMLEKLKDKYICLNRSRDSNSNTSSGNTNPSAKSVNDGIPKPKVMLHSERCLKLAWNSPRRVGSGLNNLGNTCFLNSVLQCLTYTPPLTNYLLEGSHAKLCKSPGFCMVCELQSHIRRALTQSGSSVKPTPILQKLKLIAKHMRWGRQEDAHEFLRYVIDGMLKSCLAGVSKSLDKASRETTLVHQVFGGYLRSQVRCLQCKTTSNTYDPVLDVSVDLKGVNSVDKALQRFVHPDVLDMDNAYFCSRCKKKVRALKQFTIHRPPRVLTLHLKRFDYHRLMGGKVSRHIEFQTKLNIRPYTSQKQGSPLNYHLYGVLVHSGFSCNSGHYYCYIKAPNQTWYCMNDSHVSQASLNTVLSSEAYILFYVLDSPSQPVTTKASPAESSLPSHVTASQNGNLKGKKSPGLSTSLSDGRSAAPSASLANGITPTHFNGVKSKPQPTVLKTPCLSHKKSTSSSTVTSSTNVASPVAATSGGGERKLSVDVNTPRRVTLTTLSDMISAEKCSSSSTNTHSNISSSTNTHNTNSSDNSTSAIKSSITNNIKEARLADRDGVNKVNNTNNSNFNRKSNINSQKTPLRVETSSPNHSRNPSSASTTKQKQKTEQRSPTENHTQQEGLMSPPPSKKKPVFSTSSLPSTEMLKPTASSHRSVTSPPSTHSNGYWKVANSNRTRHASESESVSSVASTTEWQVTSSQDSLASPTTGSGIEKQSTIPATTSKQSTISASTSSSSSNELSTTIHKRKSKKEMSCNAVSNSVSCSGVTMSDSVCNGVQPTQRQADLIKTSENGEMAGRKRKKKRKRDKKLNEAVGDDSSQPPVKKKKKLKSTVNESGQPVEERKSKHQVSSTDSAETGPSESSEACHSEQRVSKNFSLEHKVSKKKKKKRKLHEKTSMEQPQTNESVQSVTGVDGTAILGMEESSEKSDSQTIIQPSSGGGGGGKKAMNSVIESSNTKLVDVTDRSRNIQSVTKPSVTKPVSDSSKVNNFNECQTAPSVKKKRKRPRSEPVVKVWDARVDENGDSIDRKPTTMPLVNGGGGGGGSVWDGRKNSNISFIMERHCSVKGLGSGVTTWDGGKPEMNRQAEIADMVSSYKSGWYNEYEQQLDEGKQKKVKSAKPRQSSSNKNSFQAIQDNTNTVLQLRKEGKLPNLG